MRKVPENIASWIDLIGKTALIPSLVLGIIMGTINLSYFLSAEARLAEKKGDFIDRLTAVYVAELEKVSAEISEIDKRLGDQVWKGTTGWDRDIALRAEKVKDRQELLRTMGQQILELKKVESGRR